MPTRYDKEFKQNIINLYKQGESAAQLAREYGIGYSNYPTFLLTNCQIKCNFLPKKTSDGVFQPKTLRGRLFKSLTNFAIS
ncbi:hypothetical protein LKI01_26090 [Companilactobacillus paralimentarius]|nr:hypothetical protein LKI01_26090 [Companilactobacillus paralimentarius]